MHLEQQRRTDHIYDLIHEYIPCGWTNSHHGDYICVERSAIPKNLELDESVQSSQSFNFNNPDIVVLKNNKLTEFLERAQAIEQITDTENRRFLLLKFNRKNSPRVSSSFYSNQPYYADLNAVQIADLNHPSDALWLAYELMRTKQNPKKALFWAEYGQSFLDNQTIVVDDNFDFEEMMRKCYGYNIVAMVFAWNNKWDKAWKADEHYIFIPQLWLQLEEVIERYLEMLMEKKSSGI